MGRHEKKKNTKIVYGILSDKTKLHVPERRRRIGCNHQSVGTTSAAAASRGIRHCPRIDIIARQCQVQRRIRSTRIIDVVQNARTVHGYTHRHSSVHGHEGGRRWRSQLRLKVFQQQQRRVRGMQLRAQRLKGEVVVPVRALDEREENAQHTGPE